MSLSRILLIAAALTTSLPALPPTPALLNWNNTPSGSWTDTNEWNDGSSNLNWVDGSDAVLTGTGFAVALPTSITARNVLINGTTLATYEFSGASTLGFTGYFMVDTGRATIGADLAVTGGDNLYVGSSLSDATLQILGSATAGSGAIGVYAASADNQLIVGSASPGASLVLTGDLDVGYEGAGNTLDVRAGSTVSLGSLKVGGFATSTNNTVTISGQLTATSDATLGYGGSDNTLTIDGANALLRTSGVLYIGFEGENNDATVSGGAWLDAAGGDAVIGDQASSDTNTLTITGNGSKLTNTATLYVGKTGSGNSLDVVSGGSLQTNGLRISANDGSATNSLTISGTGSELINTGSLRVGSLGDSATLTVENGATATISANLFLGHGSGSTGNRLSVTGAGSSLTAGSVTIGRTGSTDNELTLADDAQLISTGAITLGGTDARLVISGEGTTLSAPLITGAVVTSNTGHVIEFAHEGLFTFAGDVSGDIAILHSGSGTTTLNGALSFTGGTQVTAGNLRIDGTIVGETQVAVGGRLGGNGDFSGDIDVLGTLAPGNSPGITTQLIGDTFLLSGSFFEAELGGLQAGEGDGFHDRHVIADGLLIISPDATLEIRQWGTFTPARGNVFTIIQTSEGISGTFSDMINADYSTLLVYDNRAGLPTKGNLYGTGLTGTQGLEAYATNATEAAFGSSLSAVALTRTDSSTTDNPAAFVDSSTPAGRAALAVILGAPLASFSPASYFGVAEYTRTASRASVDGALRRGPTLKEGTWSFSYGHARADSRDSRLEQTLRSDSAALTATNDLGGGLQAGGYIGGNSGRSSAGTSTLDFEGAEFGLFVRSAAKIGSQDFTLEAAIFGGSYAFDAQRETTAVGTSGGNLRLTNQVAGARDVGASSTGAKFLVSTNLTQLGAVTLSPYAGLVTMRTKSDAFTESGSELTVAEGSSDSTRSLLGLSAGATWGKVSLTASFGVEHEHGDSVDNLSGSLGDATVAVTTPEADKTVTVTGITANWALSTATQLSLGTEVRSSDTTEGDRRVFVSLGHSF